MAPKKKQAQTMSLGDFLNDSSFGGSWADEVEDTIGTQQLPPTGDSRSTMGMGGNTFGTRDTFRSSAPVPLPTRPPFTAHIGNLPYDATEEAVTEFFDACGVLSVRIIEDRELMRPKGFAYVEFHELDGLKMALDLDADYLNGRPVRVKVADNQRSGGGDFNRDLSDWSRKGPLADLPGRGGDRGYSGGYSERRTNFESADDGPPRDFGNWERRGPLSPRMDAPEMSRDGSRARTMERGDGMRNSHQSPGWGEGRQEGSRPPPGEFRERAAPTAAELDNKWRSNMRPDAPSPSLSRDGSEAPSSPSAVHATLAGGRPKLNLAKRTVSVSETAGAPAAAPASDSSKPNPFGAARPIDTVARERAIEERKAKEKLEAEEKAKEERRLAKEAAAKEEAAREEAAKAAEEAAKAKAEADALAAEAAAAKEVEDAAAAKAGAEAEAEAEAAATGEAKPEEANQDSGDNGKGKAQRGPRAREPREPRDPKDRPDVKSRATESGNWRSAVPADQRAPRGPPGGPRRGGGGGARGARHEGPRPPRANGSQQQPAAAAAPAETPASADASEPGSPEQDADGWVTVPKGGRRQGRPVAS